MPPLPSPRSLANLRPWKKGQSGNPAGRAKKTGPDLKDWVDFARESADGKLDKDGCVTYTRDDAVMRALYMICINTRHRDCVPAIRVWLDRVRGKVPDKHEIGGKGDFADEENPLTTVLEGLLVKARQQETDKKRAKGKTKIKGTAGKVSAG